MSKKVRRECIAPKLADSCTEGHLCPQCSMEKDVQENPELYAALAGNGGGD